MSLSNVELLDFARFGPRDLMAEFMRRQRTLTIFGLTMLGLMVPALVLGAIDERTVRDVGVWAKPLKFMAATALFALSTAWSIPSGDSRRS